MNIGFINSIQMFGGGEVWMLRTLLALQARGHAVRLLCRPGTQLEEKARAAGIEVTPLSMRGDFDPVTIFRTAMWIRRHRLQVLLTNMDKELRFAGIAAKLVGGCAVFPRRGIDYPLKNRLHYRLSYNWLAQALIANSQATKQALLRNAPWLEPDRIHVIYNGIDPAPFLSPPDRSLRQEWGIPDAHPVIGFVGQLDPRKGIDTLLEAFAQVHKHYPDVHLVLVGDGRLNSAIRQFGRQKQLNDRIHTVGFENDIPNVMKTIDLLVLPSRWEGFGIVLIEAMAAGKPTVTTAISSMPEIVVDEVTGKVVPVDDPQQLAEAISTILRDPGLARHWGELGRKRVMEMFHIDEMVRQLESLFSASLSFAIRRQR